MLEVIEDMNFSADSLSSDNVMTLWHVSGFVNFTSMIDLCFHSDSLILKS
jgi:hypothetical protein